MRNAASLVTSVIEIQHAKKCMLIRKQRLNASDC